nr:uncharacterized protein LOC113811272 [Penaeus vannamei]
MDVKKSICYMSLADAFLSRLRKEAVNRTRSRIMKGVGVEVLPVSQDRQDFIYDYLTKLYEQKKGTFSKPKIFARQTIYECERSNACKGNSSGDPTKTRANGCTAYVSFMFEEGATITACIIRYRLVHNGHDPTNREESRVSRIDQSLRLIIESHLKGGMKVSDVMNEIAKWNKAHKHTDHKNRRYFPSRQDIQQLALSLKKPIKVPLNNSLESKKPRKYDTLNKDNVTRLLRTEYRETCVYYQSRTTTGANPRPLIVVLQNSEQRDMFNLHGQHLVFIEKNYEGLRQYGNAVYVLVVRDNQGNAFPVAYVITSSDDGHTFTQALEKLRSRCQTNPKIFFLDRELHSFAEAMSTMYTESLFLISWHQVAQEVHKWLQTSPVSEKEHADVRRVLIHFISELKGTETEEEFIFTVSEMEQRIEFAAFTSMLQADWLPCAEKWCDFSRNCFYDMEANSLIERFFLKIHHQFLKGLHTRKSLEELLRLIADNVMEHRNFIDGMVNMSILMEGTASEQAGVLLHQGWSQLVTWQGHWMAHVPCHNIPETVYRVNLVTMECECPTLTYLGPCLHLCLLLMLAQSREGLTPEQERHRLASEAYENSDFIMDGVSCMTFHNGILCVTELGNRKCTCVASAFDVECVGKILLKIADGTEEAVTYTIPSSVVSASKLEGTSPPHIVSSESDVQFSGRDGDISSYTITVSSQPEKSTIPSSTHSLKVENEKPIVIQTRTKVEARVDSLERPKSRSLLLCDQKTKGKGGIKQEFSIDPKLSSQEIIEKLYKWSTSSSFTDSDLLNEMLRDIHNHVWEEQYPVLSEIQAVKENTSKKPVDPSKKKLRAVVRTVKRQRNTDDHEDDQILAVIPSLKVSRSGRHIKIKEEPDFVT